VIKCVFSASADGTTTRSAPRGSERHTSERSAEGSLYSHRSRSASYTIIVLESV